MNHVVALAALQRLADVNAELDDVAPRHRMFVDIRQQRVQQLHPDQNVPADTIRMFKHPQIFAAYNVRRALELEHDGKLMHKFLYDSVKVCLSLWCAHAFGKDAPDFRLTLRYGDDFQRRLIRLAKLRTLHFKNSAIAAFAQRPRNFPAV